MASRRRYTVGQPRHYASRAPLAGDAGEAGGAHHHFGARYRWTRPGPTELITHPVTFAFVADRNSLTPTSTARSQRPPNVDFGLRPECAITGHPRTAWRTGQIDRGCVKTSARFHTSLFRSLLRGLRAFRVEKIAKSLALLHRLQNFAEFLHGLRP
jgi:hypothetical protein